VTAVGCKASWFGAFDLRARQFAEQIEAIRNQGGEVKVSFGGANGVELGVACTNLAALIGEYQAVIDAYRLTFMDLGITGAASADSGSVARRSAALQQRNPGLKVSLTLPVRPEGLTGDGLNVVRSARDAGVSVDLVNIMAMDFGRPNQDYGTLTIDAVISTATQLKTVFPDKSDAQINRMVGVTPMIGRNDDQGTFDQDDARGLIALANSTHIGFVSFWETLRDRNACSGRSSIARTSRRRGLTSVGRSTDSGASPGSFREITVHSGSTWRPCSIGLVNVFVPMATTWWVVATTRQVVAIARNTISRRDTSRPTHALVRPRDGEHVAAVRDVAAVDLRHTRRGEHVADYCFRVIAGVRARRRVNPAALVVGPQDLRASVPVRRVRVGGGRAGARPGVREHRSHLPVRAGRDRRFVPEQDQVRSWFGVPQAAAQRFAAGGDDVLDRVAGRVQSAGPHRVEHSWWNRMNPECDCCRCHVPRMARPDGLVLAVIGRCVATVARASHHGVVARGPARGSDDGGRVHDEPSRRSAAPDSPSGPLSGAGNAR
jgi:hypothetical protein